MSSFVLNGSAASANYMQAQLPYHLPEYYQQSGANQLIPANHTPLDYAAVSAVNFPYGYANSNNNHSFHQAAQQLSSQLPTSNNLHPSLHNIPPSISAKTTGLAAHPPNGQSSSGAATNQQLSVNLPPTTVSTSAQSTVQNHLSTVLPPATNSHHYTQHPRYQHLINSSSSGQPAATTNSPINHHQPNYHNSDLLTTVSSNGSSSGYTGATTPLNGASVLNSPANHNSSTLLNEAESLANNLPNNYPYNPFNSTEFNRHLSSYNGSPLLGSGSANSSPSFVAAAAHKTANDQFLSSIQSGQNSHLNNLNNHLANQHLNNLNNLANHNASYTSPLAALSNAVNNSSFIPSSAPFQCKIEPTPDSPPESTSSNSLHSMNGAPNGHQLSLTNGNSLHHNDYRPINPGQSLHHPSLIGAHQLTSSTNDSCSMMSIDNNSSQNTFSSSNPKATHIYPWMKKNSQVNAGKFRLSVMHYCEIQQTGL